MTIRQQYMCNKEWICLFFPKEQTLLGYCGIVCFHLSIFSIGGGWGIG